MGNINKLIEILSSQFNRSNGWGKIPFDFINDEDNENNDCKYKIKIYDENGNGQVVFHFDKDENLLCITNLRG